jgi:protein-tyrosine phosphatase
MAAAIFRQIVNDLGDGALWRIDSAGTWGIDGAKASDGTLRVLQSRGIDLSAHASKIVNNPLLESADLILVMEKGHKEALKLEYPHLAGRVFLLSEMVGEEIEIEDPIGGPLSAYESTAKEIEQILRRGYAQIKQLCKG